MRYKEFCNWGQVCKCVFCRGPKEVKSSQKSNLCIETLIGVKKVWKEKCRLVSQSDFPSFEAVPSSHSGPASPPAVAAVDQLRSLLLTHSFSTFNKFFWQLSLIIFFWILSEVQLGSLLLNLWWTVYTSWDMGTLHLSVGLFVFCCVFWLWEHFSTGSILGLLRTHFMPDHCCQKCRNLNFLYLVFISNSQSGVRGVKLFFWQTFCTKTSKCFLSFPARIK